MRWVRRGLLGLAALAAILPLAVRLGPAAAGPGARPLGLSLVGSLPLETTARDVNADVAVLGRLAFVGEWSGPCPGTGVAVIDVSDPARPALLSRTPAHPDTSMEVMRAVRIDGRDVLAVGLQDCGKDPRPGVGRAGLELVDVTDPRQPADLSFFDVDQFGARVVGVHELDVTRTPAGRWLALLAAPDLEAATAGVGGAGGIGDLVIVDITDPTRPVLDSSWGVLGEPALGPSFYRSVRRGNDARTLLHSVRAGRSGTIAYLSYWDAGVLLLDISNPSRPRYLGRTVFEAGEEGNAHSVDATPDGRVIAEADEVLNPFQARLTGSALAGARPATEATFTPPLNGLPGRALSGVLAYVGRGCLQDAYEADPMGRVALVERGGCRFDEKVARAQRAGATGVVVFDDAAEPDDLGPMSGSRQVTLADGGSVTVAIPAVLVPRDTGLRLRDLGGTVTAAATFTGWGGLRLWDVSDPRRPRLLARFATRQAQDPSAAGRGLWSVHNPVIRGTTLYASSYSDGVFVLDISRPAAPSEVAAWTGQGRPAGAPAVDIWGVAVTGSLVFASDRGFGLYVLRFAAESGVTGSQHEQVRPGAARGGSPASTP